MYNRSSHQNYRDGDKFSFSRSLSDGDFQLTDPRSAKILDKVVEEVQKISILFLRSCKNTYFCKNLQENLHTSVKILKICMEFQDSVQRFCRTLQKKSCRSAQIRKDRKPGISPVAPDFDNSG